MPKPWVAWLGLLMALNTVVPLFFLPAAETWAALVCILLGTGIMTAIFAARGFVRLLGLGHLPWLALLPWLWGRLDLYEPGNPMRTWMVPLIAANALSLLIDAVDVVRYIRGERAPTLDAPG